MITRQQEFVHFFGSSLWSDISRIVQKELDDAHLQMELVDDARVLQGKCQAWRRVLELPKHIEMLFNIEDELNKEGEQKDVNDND